MRLKLLVSVFEKSKKEVGNIDVTNPVTDWP